MRRGLRFSILFPEQSPDQDFMLQISERYDNPSQGSEKHNDDESRDATVR